MAVYVRPTHPKGLSRSSWREGFTRKLHLPFLNSQALCFVFSVCTLTNKCTRTDTALEEQRSRSESAQNTANSSTEIIFQVDEASSARRVLQSDFPVGAEVQVKSSTSSRNLVFQELLTSKQSLWFGQNFDCLLDTKRLLISHWWWVFNREEKERWAKESEA